MLFYTFIILVSCLMTFFTLKNEKINCQSKKYKLTLIIVFLLIIFLRVLKYDSSMGLNPDEAMGGYNSWCLAHYGVDSHLMKAPVYLIAWGSGMNILYPLMSIPVVKFFGLSTLSYRFLMVLLSIVSMFTLYNALMKSSNHSKLNLLFIIALYLNPWMIMANRWALESNFFPIVMIFALSAFLMFENNNVHKLAWFILFTMCVALSAYSYSNNWMFLAIFVPAIFVFLLIKKKINLKFFVLGIIEILAIVWPLLLFVYVNYIGGHTLHVWGLTIPKLWASRIQGQTIFGNTNGTPFILAMINNFLGNISTIANGGSMICNSLPGIGLMFPGMFLIALIGLVVSIKNLRSGSLMNVFMFISMISTLPILFLVTSNANHMNAVILPIFYFVALGLKQVLNTKFLQKSAVVFFTIMMIWFSYGYFIQNAASLSNCQWVTPLNLRTILSKANKTKKKVYIINDQNGGMFAITRFWEPVSPYVFNKTKSNDPKQSIMNYQYYSKWHFSQSIDSSMKNLNNTVFVILSSDSSNLSNLPDNVHKVKNYGDYVVYEN